LFACVRRTEAREGDWRLLEREAAWHGNPTWDRFIAFSWEAPGRRSDIDGRAIVVRDLMSPVVRHERHGADLWRQGLYLDVPPWGYHVFEVTT
jgi:hypothetical protein